MHKRHKCALRFLARFGHCAKAVLFIFQSIFLPVSHLPCDCENFTVTTHTFQCKCKWWINFFMLSFLIFVGLISLQSNQVCIFRYLLLMSLRFIISVFESCLFCLVRASCWSYKSTSIWCHLFESCAATGKYSSTGLFALAQPTDIYHSLNSKYTFYQSIFFTTFYILFIHSLFLSLPFLLLFSEYSYV